MNSTAQQARVEREPTGYFCVGMAWGQAHLSIPQQEGWGATWQTAAKYCRQVFMYTPLYTTCCTGLL